MTVAGLRVLDLLYTERLRGHGPPSRVACGMTPTCSMKAIQATHISVTLFIVKRRSNRRGSGCMFEYKSSAATSLVHSFDVECHLARRE